ncbi:GTP 3',8-cyclase MoaA [Agromyces sp. MMS24-JH15]|uniref:GTP 3',8-cyclase MoaA n=1 Tax=Agromyces sp. MMS24-JH15 TaxID=3243765 RepID=UPI0037486A96
MTTLLGIPRVRTEDPRATAESAARRLEASGRPSATGLVDRFGRVATDLRVSLTDRCNLRCTYCMPAEGLPWAAAESLMSAEEIARLVGIAVERLGVRQVRFTGGEPLLRRDLADIVAACAALPDRPELSLTTNGIGLAERAGALAAAGLDRVNISLDSLRHETFERITRRRLLHRVLEGVDGALAAGLGPLKVNAVLMRGVNDGEAAELVEWAVARDIELRFIEQMPLDADHAWSRVNLVTGAEIRERVGERFELVPDGAPRDGAPAERWEVRRAGEPVGRIGIIASVTEPFCADCRRTRLTGDGRVRSCLFSLAETDLLGPLRAGADDEALADLWRLEMWGKAAGHGVNAPGFTQPDRPMSAIGG